MSDNAHTGSPAKLSAATMMQAAREETGLSDFGNEWFVAPLEKLVAETNEHAGLVAPEAGAGARIQSALADRLKLEQYFKDHPEAADEVITPACAIIGLPRTGSTMVHRLLASSPKMTALYWWETAFPFPMPDEAPDDPTPRQEAAKGYVDFLLQEWPDFESIDPMDAMAVNEEVVLLDRMFLCTTYDSMMPIHAYGHWQAEQDQEAAYRDLYRFMQVIQHQRGRRGDANDKPRWVFKTPHHLLGGIGGLLAVWPDLPLVMTHRDVAEVVPSYCSMCASLSIGSSTTYKRDDQGAHWTARFANGLARFEDIRSRLPEGQVVDVLYTDTVSDPVGTAAKVMEGIGMGFDETDRAQMLATIEANKREARPRHKYSADQFGLTPEGIASDFAFYHDKYLPAEN